MKKQTPFEKKETVRRHDLPIEAHPCELLGHAPRDALGEAARFFVEQHLHGEKLIGEKYGGEVDEREPRQQHRAPVVLPVGCVHYLLKRQLDFAKEGYGSAAAMLAQSDAVSVRAGLVKPRLRGLQTKPHRRVRLKMFAKHQPA